MVKTMADKPLILALANPVPEILPEDAKAVRPDCIIATGRSDYPNQVNNVLCFPFIFRGALDVGATTITQEMELATVRAIADLAHAEQSDVVAAAYAGSVLNFGPEYLIPKPFDPRLIVKIAPAVARAAMDSGVATRPIADFDAYREQLQQFVYHSGLLMKPVFTAAKNIDKRIVYAEGEDERVLRAVQVVVDERLARPILIGRPEVIEHRIEKCGLRIRPGVDFELCNPQNDPRYKDYWQTYHQLTERKGVSPGYAQIEMRRRHTLIGAMMIHKGHADGMLCGTFGTYALHLHYVDQVIGRARASRLLRHERPDAAEADGLHLRHLRELRPERRTAGRDDPAGGRGGAPLRPDAEGGAALALQFRQLRHAQRAQDAARHATALERAPELEVEGEMHGDAALSGDVRAQVFPNARLKGEANLLVMPTLDAANIAFNLLKQAAGDGVTIGPILLGTRAPVTILTPTATVRRIVNLTALTVVEAARG
jgi:malate dehydrogenase (oxaloacetate-decarboxylating)(NADP+)